MTHWPDILTWGGWVETGKGGWHFATAIMAIVFGAINLVAQKGTRPHRIVGTAYVVAMLTVNTTALTSYNISGAMTLFHWFALASLATLLPAYVLIVFYKLRKQKWMIAMHAQFMAWSYFGLVAAGAWQVALKLSMPLMRPESYLAMIWTLGLLTFLASITVFWWLNQLRRRLVNGSSESTEN